MPFSDAVEQNVIDHFLGNSTWAEPTKYLALFVSGVEVSGNNYSRVQTTNVDWNAASAGNPSSADNSAEITFPTATGGDWGNIDEFRIFDAATLGNELASGTISPAKTVQDGDTAKFGIGQLLIKVGADADTF